MKRMDVTTAVTLLSQALFVSLLFLVLSGALTVGREAILYFSGVALLTALGSALFAPEIIAHPKKAYPVAAGVVVLGAWAGWKWVPQPSTAFLICFVVLGMWLVQRMWRGMAQDPAFFRDDLLDETRRDGLLLLAASLLVSVYSVRDGWDGEALPLLFTWAGLRMAALWKGTRQMGGAGSGGMEWLGICLFLTAGWSLTFFGPFLYSTAVRGLILLLSPLLYGAGWMVQHLVAFLSGGSQKLELPSMFEGQETSPRLFDASEAASVPSEGWDWLGPLILGAVMAGVFIFFFRRLQTEVPPGERSRSHREIREFIPAGRKAEPQAAGVAYSSSDTWMRRLYRRFLLRMKRAGSPRHLDETPWEYVRRMAAAHPDLREPMEELTARYMEERYGGRPFAGDRREAERLFLETVTLQESRREGSKAD